MKITQSQIQMQSQHVYQHEQSKQESLKTWIGDEPPTVTDGPQATSELTGQGGDRLSLSDMALRQYLDRSMQQGSQPQTASPSTSNEDPKVMAMRLILEALTGKKISIDAMDESQPDSGSIAITQPSPDAPAQGGQAKAGWGLEYHSHEVNAEHEEMSFQAQGQVQTADGRQMNVQLAMGTSRDFVETSDVQLRAGDAVKVDPLVINFADQPPNLTDQKVAFDLNSDGKSEQISFVSPGSGFLFLDRNNDGKATDGSELFGPQNGNGFADLARLDSDGNGWLDDNDPMFAKLKLWAKDAAGSDYFASLKELNIGAIQLSHQATPFSLNNQQNSQLGQITDSGLFLREDGSAGSIQEIRLTV
jgi:hypothetical protein